MNLTKEQQFGVISSVIFLVIFTGLLLLFGFSSPFPPPEEEGILINFGTSETGFGAVEPRPAAQPIEEKSVPEPVNTPDPVQTSDSKEEVLTQDFDKTAVIEAKKKKEKEQQEEIKRKQKEEELERKRQEEIEEQKRIEEERIRKEEAQKAINDRAKNAFGGQNAAGDNTGEGETSGNGNQGNPDGDINSTNRTGGSTGGNGISFNLSGRSHRSLPSPPKIHKTDGKVIVEVSVDQNGTVLSARPGVKGTTISDEALWNVAKEAALKATFNVDRNAAAVQKGTITYLFGFE
jgi:outer membrane biosynthesis protein TonB